MNFTAYSEAAFTAFIKSVEQFKGTKTAHSPFVEERYRLLMADKHFSKTNELTQAKQDVDKWIAEKKNASAKAATRDASSNLPVAQITIPDPSLHSSVVVNQELPTLKTDTASNNNKSPGTVEARSENTAVPMERNTEVANSESEPMPRDSFDRLFAWFSNHASMVLWILSINLVICVILHSIEVVTIFTDYTDVAMTFLGPAACLSTNLALTSFGVSEVWTERFTWATVLLVAFFGTRFAVRHNRNPVLALMVFVAKYTISGIYLIVWVLGLLCGAATAKRRGETEREYAFRSERERERSKFIGGMVTGFAVMLSTLLVREQGFSPLSEYLFQAKAKRTSRRTSKPRTTRSRKRRAAPSEDSAQAESSNEEQNGTVANESPNNPFHILEISKDASIEEIRSAYRERMKEYHPDKVAGLGKDIRELAENKAKAINAAYEELVERHRVQGSNTN
jgi:DnaJ like chaperone protein